MQISRRGRGANNQGHDGHQDKAINHSPVEVARRVALLSSRLLQARQRVGNLRRSSHHHEQGAETDCCYERGSRGIDLSVVATEICKLTPVLAAPAIIRKANYLAVAHDVPSAVGVSLAAQAGRVSWQQGFCWFAWWFERSDLPVAR